MGRRLYSVRTLVTVGVNLLWSGLYRELPSDNNYGRSFVSRTIALLYGQRRADSINSGRPTTRRYSCFNSVQPLTFLRVRHTITDTSSTSSPFVVFGGRNYAAADRRLPKQSYYFFSFENRHFRSIFKRTNSRFTRVSGTQRPSACLIVV